MIFPLISQTCFMNQGRTSNATPHGQLPTWDMGVYEKMGADPPGVSEKIPIIRAGWRYTL